ncbi:MULTISPECIES: hypothetical protein [Pseudonocardia]|uniref:Uncharacterized protein n=2 Tax=Pseudonocardia TaxID=1847 RepID=A0A1Y2N4K1_PSEAH|nr:MULTISPECIES: hypothetical protein [Pseudonocardia]OSY42395.1 hypothetical protein BG845_01315 [Pseudonocardia autotrophica]TDN75915.1 hypothetical protein C8E95_5100 [Pseudonocardia autotrophica]BBF99887.1 hypothetical protein Pdca_10970 [Pseudonocardia autotrophica]GEC28896.1 hypothetical protein PSA01_59250 [Pseudonocardia saturnea]
MTTGWTWWDALVALLLAAALGTAAAGFRATLPVPARPPAAGCTGAALVAALVVTLLVRGDPVLQTTAVVACVSLAVTGSMARRSHDRGRAQRC